MARTQQFLPGKIQGPGDRRGPSSMSRAYRVADPSIATAEPGTPIPFLLSSPGTKRDGLNLATLPFLLDNYRKNPVVLPFHSYFDFSIGRGLIETIDGPGGQSLYAEAAFDVQDPIGELADRKYRGGFMFAVSLGWDDVDKNGVPVRVSKGKPVARDVLEFSVVSVPGDADALIDGGGRGMDPEELQAGRRFLVQVGEVLVATDPRADAIEDALQRLAACAGPECESPLADARRLLDRDVSPAEGAEPAQGTDEPETPDSSEPADEASVEVRRRVAMAAMVAAVWVDEGDEADDRLRERARKALIPEYRRLGMVPPPQLDASFFASLPLQRKRALFGNGELEEHDMTVLSGAGQRVGKKFSGATRTKMESIVADLKSALEKQKALLAEADDDSGERVAATGHRCSCGGHVATAEPVEPDPDPDSRALLDEALTALSALYPDVDIRVEARGAAPRAAAPGRARQVSDISVVEVAAAPEDVAYVSGSVVLPEKVQQYLKQKAIARLEAGTDGTETTMWFTKWTDDPEYPLTPSALLGVDVIDSIPENVMSLLRALAAGADEAILDIDGVLASDPDWTDGDAAPAEEPPADAPVEDVPAEDATATADEPQTLTIDDLLAQWAPLSTSAQAQA